MSTRIHPKMSMKIHPKCPREFTYFVHENSLFMSMRNLPPLPVTDKCIAKSIEDYFSINFIGVPDMFIFPNLRSSVQLSNQGSVKSGATEK